MAIEGDYQYVLQDLLIIPNVSINDWNHYNRIMENDLFSFEFTARIRDGVVSVDNSLCLVRTDYQSDSDEFDIEFSFGEYLDYAFNQGTDDEEDLYDTLCVVAARFFSFDEIKDSVDEAITKNFTIYADFDRWARSNSKWNVTFKNFRLEK